ncbi:hypothetical protein [Mesobacillus stamsii]|uniref:Uncharacterized protein n=1 Tax=Mesobacillus stamsii TaxID=225347 RepID=A0ABU0FWD1_9BACI|nr:hypothetical protein [Mesobacillus stamsii]MDQ0414229.1 hypothetical protein [Mesobacillus stamsii]
MKVKAIIDCVGYGYDLKVGETTELNKELADKLIRFGYVEEVKARKAKDKE